MTAAGPGLRLSLSEDTHSFPEVAKTLNFSASAIAMSIDSEEDEESSEDCIDTC